jgi:peptidoglycan/LPS O-acetylase OafA/YrhL
MTAVVTSPRGVSEADPVALKPPPGHPRFAHLDALRGMAALMVVTVHCGAQAHVETQSWAALILRLNWAVAVFFGISGFLLYRPMVAARVGAPRRSVRDYYRGRFLRIAPGYWMALTLLAIWPGLVGVFTAKAPIYYGALQIYWSDTIFGALAPAWTLCVEVTFYALLPLWAALAGRFTRRHGFSGGARREGLALVVAALLALSWHSVIEAKTAHDYLGQSLLGMFDWFAMGMGLALLSVAETRAPSRAGRVLAARPWAYWTAAAGLFAFLCFGPVGLPNYPTWPPPHLSLLQVAAEHFGYGLIGLLLLIPAAFPGDGSGWPRRLLRWPPLVWIGVISYGLFLYHDPLIYKLAAGGALKLIPGSPFISMTLVTWAVAIPIGALSWYLLERPLLRLKRRGAHAR